MKLDFWLRGFFAGRRQLTARRDEKREDEAERGAHFMTTVMKMKMVALKMMTPMTNNIEDVVECLAHQ